MRKAKREPRAKKLLDFRMAPYPMRFQLWRCTHAQFDTVCDEIAGGKTLPTNPAHSACTYTNRRRNICVIGVFTKPGLRTRATLAHECAHVALEVFHSIGTRPSAGHSSEPFCYLLDELFEACEDALWPEVRKRKIAQAKRAAKKRRKHARRT